MTDLLILGSLASDKINDLRSFSAVASNNNYDSFQMPVGTFYQVPNNIKFIITKITSTGSTANTKFQIGYADDSVDDSGVAPTNPVFLTPLIPNETANIIYQAGGILVVPTTKYPFIMSTGGTGTVAVAGIELAL